MVIRHYNSQSSLSGDGFGPGWSAFPGLTIVDASHVVSARPDGKRYTYTLSGGTWSADADVNHTLASTAGGYQLTTSLGELETYDASGKLLSISDRAGLTQTLTYGGGGQLQSVSDAYGRQLTFTHDGAGRIDTLTDPAGGVYRYAYDGVGNLASVTYPDDTPADATDNPKKIYHYEDPNFPNALTGISDETGTRFATWAYDASGRAVSSQHSGGAERVDLTYNPDGTTTVTDALGTARTYGFTTVLGVVKATGQDQPAGSGCGAASSAIGYDANGNVASRADFNGHATTYAHDLTRNLETSRTEAAGTPEQRTLETDWHPSLRAPVEIREQNAAGAPLRTTRLTHDGDNNAANPKGDLTRREIIDHPSGKTRAWNWTYAYSASVPGALLQKTEDGPRTDVADTTTWDYYAPDILCDGAADGPGRDKGCRGQLRQVTNALGHVTRIPRYNAHGQPETVADANDVLTTLTYDARQRLTGHTVDGFTTTYSYDPAGQLTRVTLPDASYAAYAYDAAHRLTGITDAAGNQVLYTLDPMGNVIREEWRNPDGGLARRRLQTFDALGRLYESVGAANQTATHAYDAQGNLTNFTDPKGQPTAHTYDALDRLKQVQDALNGLTHLGYDPLDQLTQVTAPNGAQTTYTVDGLGDTTQETSADNGTATYVHDAAGNVTQRTDARGIITTYTWDALNRLTRVDVPGVNGLPPTAIDYTWDSGNGCDHGIGRLCRVADTDRETTYAYDGRGNRIGQTRVEDGETHHTLTAPDPAGRPHDLLTPTGETLLQVRDAAGRVSEIATAHDILVRDITYDATGQVTAQTLGINTTVNAAYDLDGQLKQQGEGSLEAAFDGDVPLPPWSLALLAGGLAAGLLRKGRYLAGGLLLILAISLGTPPPPAQAADLAYTYDANGNIQNKTTPAGTTAYTYDPLDRLDTETGPQGDRNHDYDANGNRTTNGAGLSVGYAPNSDRLVLINGVLVTLDAAGNLTQDDQFRYTWDGLNRLKAVRDLGNTLIATYYYDHRGLRTRKVTTAAAPQGAGKTFYHYDQDDHLIAETGPGNTPLATYVWRDDSLAGVVMHQPSRTECTVEIDVLGSPFQVRTRQGQVVWRWESEGYGNTPPDEDVDGDGTLFTLNLRFPGQYFDKETGLHYNHHRYYSPRLARYLSPDPIGLAGGLNLYTYVGGNPLSNIDPAGLFESPAYLRVIVPGQVSFDNALTSIENRNYGMAGAYAAAMLGEQVMAVLSLGQSQLYQRSTQCTAKAAKGAAPFSRIVPGGGLAAHEAAGGHLLARHVGQSEADLAARLAAQPRLSAASTFASRAEAEAAISGALNTRAADVNAWVTAGARGRLVVDAPFSGGSVLQRGATAAVPGTGVRAVLEGSGGGGWRIITGYPTP